MYLHSKTGIELTKQSCTLLNSNCQAICHCREGYSGQYCEINQNNLRKKRYLRSQLAHILKHLTTFDVINTETVTSWSSNLYSIALLPCELSIDVYVLTDIANTTLYTALELGIDKYAAMAGVLQTTDTMASVFKYNYDPSVYSIHRILHIHSLITLQQ